MPVCTIKLKSVTATQLWMVINMIDPRFFCSGHHLEQLTTVHGGGELTERPKPVQLRNEKSKSEGLA